VVYYKIFFERFSAFNHLIVIEKNCAKRHSEVGLQNFFSCHDMGERYIITVT
jgi:hypothetical protein